MTKLHGVSGARAKTCPRRDRLAFHPWQSRAAMLPNLYECRRRHEHFAWYERSEDKMCQAGISYPSPDWVQVFPTAGENDSPSTPTHAPASHGSRRPAPIIPE